MDKKINNICISFFEKLGINIETISITEEKEKNYFIKIMSNESSLLIGNKGQNFESILNILTKIIIKNYGKDIKIKLEINDYIKNKDEIFKGIIINEIKKVKNYGKDIKLKQYSSFERKKIHNIVSEYGENDIYTKSIGEGKERRIYICKKQNSLKIDIDGNDI